MIELIFLCMFITIALLVIAARSVANVKENERLVVFRLGKYLGVFPPGLNIVIPFLDKRVRVNVEQIPGWEALSEEELRERAVEIALKQS